MVPFEHSPTLTEVVGFEELPFGAPGSRRAVARWRDGSVSEALRWRSGVLICEGDLIGKTREELQSLHLRREQDRI